MEGGCHCGAVRFKAHGEPYWVGACYCVDCRKISGGPFSVFAGFNEGEVQLIAGIPKEYSSSENVIRSFCDQCGSPFFYSHKNSPNKRFVPVGVLDDPTSFAPKHHIWVSQKLSWVVIHDDFPQEQ